MVRWRARAEGQGGQARTVARTMLGWTFAACVFAVAAGEGDIPGARMTPAPERGPDEGPVAEIARMKRLDGMQAVADAQGNVTAAWIEGAAVHAVRRDAARDAWSGAVRIGPEPTASGQLSFNLQVAADAVGTAFVAWMQDTSTGRHVFVARRVAGQVAWQAAQRVTRADKSLQADVHELVLLVAPDGDATAIWSEIVDTQPSAVRALSSSVVPQRRHALQAARFDAARECWSAPIPVDPRRTGGYGFGVSTPPAAAMDGDGNVTVAWNDQVVDRPFLLAARIRNELKTSRFDVRDGRWEKPQVLARCANAIACSPWLRSGADGTIWAAWSEVTAPPIDRDVFVARRAPQDRRWSQPLRLTDCRQDDCGGDPSDLDTTPSGGVAIRWALGDRTAGAWLPESAGAWHPLPVTPWPVRIGWLEDDARLFVIGGSEFDAAGEWNSAGALMHYAAGADRPKSQEWRADATPPLTLPVGFVQYDRWRMRAFRLGGIRAVVSAGRFAPPRTQRRGRDDGRFQVVLNRYDTVAGRWLAPTVVDEVGISGNALLGSDPGGVIPLATTPRAAVILWWHEDAHGLVLKSADYRF